MFVAFFLEVGLLLVVLPWSLFWERNYFATAWPWLRLLVGNHFVRGAVSGLGAVNLAVGLSDLASMFGGGARPEDPGATS